jgi:hypothetical protein
MEQLPYVVNCLNNNPRWGKKEVMSFWNCVSGLAGVCFCFWLVCSWMEVLVCVFGVWVGGGEAGGSVGRFVLIRRKLFGLFCAVDQYVLGFQHYLTMLGTTVLIPTLVFRSIGVETVGSSGER